MNPFARLIDPALPVPQPAVMEGRVHILADEIDHTTMAPASKPGPKEPFIIADRPPHVEVRGLPQLEVQYERDESVCLVATARGSLIVQVYFPVACWVPTVPTPAAPNRRAKGQP
jgi:hypothetical protein